MLFETSQALLGSLTGDERARMQLPSGRDGRAYNLYLQGIPYLRAGDQASLAIAEQFFTKSLEIDSASVEAHVSLGAVYNARYFLGIEGGQVNFELAKDEFEKAARLDPDSPLVMRALANVYWQEGKNIPDLEIAVRALKIKPRTLDVLLVAAEAYTLGGLPKYGLDLSERVLDADPSNPTARYFATVASAWSGQSEKA